MRRQVHAEPRKLAVKRILIADDLDDFRALMRVMLPSGSFEIVGEATNGREAIDLSSSEKPDVILLDLAMPAVDGLTAIPEIRTHSPGTKIVVLSGFDSAWMAERALLAGADRYIQKGQESTRITAELAGLWS